MNTTSILHAGTCDPQKKNIDITIDQVILTIENQGLREQERDRRLALQTPNTYLIRKHQHAKGMENMRGLTSLLLKLTLRRLT